MAEEKAVHAFAGVRRPVRHFIGGSWVEAVSGRTYDNRSPWSGDVLSQVAAGDGEDARRAIEEAQSAFAGWAQTGPARRQAVFLRAADVLEAERGRVVEALALETGCATHFAHVQIDFAANLLRQAAQLAYRPTGELLPSDMTGTHAMAVRRPVGVVGAIAPWNASLTLSGRAIVGPLALGNTVVLKPSEESPYTGGALWAEILQEAGLPAGALNVVTHAPGEAGLIADAMLASRLVKRLNFTGSTPTGRRLAEKAGTHLKRVVLQLSGQNPLIVAEDADLNYAVDAAAYGAFLHQGQICMCARRIYVARSIAEPFLEKFAAKVAALPIGDPADPKTVVGPVINEWALALLERRVKEAVDAGAKILAGGQATPPCYPATVLIDVPADAEIVQGETFGPVVTVEVVESAEAAVDRANRSDLGLAASIISRDVRQALHLAARLEVGIVHVNDQPVNDEPHMPFGGVKDTGWGRFGVGFAAEEFCELQWISVREQSRSFHF
ncbi:aldehyde dehydrogenase family protein [Planosporangium mesophilum]|uniref:Aldehyde dehydrogenase n=1 Tax=Planosporangium mesophilum TaxID=689768 RepID=A0A8J3TBC8_9ACTN|nr:aldehyde dehydrogenase family protein [Planosporangium mesophilum]NJC85325.1 aldehyde dehydrogenase family protein [Planosporangium mesophilum]GII23214.1 aldehyde dehydrogenase [Planosporangium mesophilum]